MYFQIKFIVCSLQFFVKNSKPKTIQILRINTKCFYRKKFITDSLTFNTVCIVQGTRQSPICNEHLKPNYESVKLKVASNWKLPLKVLVFRYNFELKVQRIVNTVLTHLFPCFFIIVRSLHLIKRKNKELC